MISPCCRVIFAIVIFYQYLEKIILNDSLFTMVQCNRYIDNDDHHLDNDINSDDDCGECDGDKNPPLC